MPAPRRGRAARAGRRGRRDRGLPARPRRRRARGRRCPSLGRGSSGRRKPRCATTWSGVPIGTEDRRAIRAGVREGAVDRQETGLGPSGAAADGQETVEAARRARVGSSRRTPGGAAADATPTASASASRRRVMPARAFRMSPSDPSSPLTVGSIGTARGAVNGASAPRESSRGAGRCLAGRVGARHERARRRPAHREDAAGTAPLEVATELLLERADVVDELAALGLGAARPRAASRRDRS